MPPEDHEAVARQYRQQTSTTIEVLAAGRALRWRPAPLVRAATIRPRATTGGASAPTWRTPWGARTSRSTALTSPATGCSHTWKTPSPAEPFAIRGLVVGYVQSGKTANFSALIAKAADAGYKIVIVLSGLHNTLRQQTQRRLERDLGRENVAGVGEPEAGRTVGLDDRRRGLG